VPIIGRWENPAVARCYGKQAYRKMTTAEEVAQRDSKRLGTLVVAYECYDCGDFHVGHADLSQRLARQNLDKNGLPTVCPYCSEPIPEERRQCAWESRSRNVYCSKRCQEKGGKKARGARRAAHVAEISSWFEHHRPPRNQSWFE